MRILYTTKEAYTKATRYLKACKYDWTCEITASGYLITVE
jgi:hypothetical protein